MLFWLCVLVCFDILHGTRFLILFVAKIGKDKIHLRDELLLIGVGKICVKRIFHQAIRLKVFACPTFILLHKGCKTRHAELLKNLRVNKTSVYLLLKEHPHVGVIIMAQELWRKNYENYGAKSLLLL